MAFVGTMTSLRNNIIPTEQSVELTITKNTITIDPNSGSYFFLDDIDSNLTINISLLSASSKTIYLRLNFEQDNIVINWPNNIKWQEITPPSISQYEDLFISLMTLDGGTTWYSEPVIKTKPIVDLSNYMGNKYPSTKGSLISLPITDLNYFNSVRPISCNSMIRDCSSLTSLDLSDLDTGNVTNMGIMFYNCSSLTSLNVSNWDTGKVTDMRNMFRECSSLTSLDLSNWDTNNVANMEAMFYGCSSLTSLDLSNLDTSNVTTMSSMFYNCSSLISLDLSTFDTSKCSNVYDMFRNCSLLEYLIIGSPTFKFQMKNSENNCGNLNTACKILVPSALLNTYKTTRYWSSRASQFDAIENYTITRSNGQVTVTPKS